MKNNFNINTCIYILILALAGASILSANDVSDTDIDNFIESHSDNFITIPKFSGKFFTLSPNKIEVVGADEQVTKDINTIWDSNKFLRPRIPVKIGVVEDRKLFEKQGAFRCIHLPIKLPNSNIRIPEEYLQFKEVIQKIINHEHSANNRFDEYYAYLTIDQGFIPRESYQRVPGPHVDGIPRDRQDPKTFVDHAYIVTNSIPTRFYFQSFDMSEYDLTKHNFFTIFRALADESQSFLTKPFEINLMNAYSVHTPEITLKDENRTFLRLEFSLLDFDREGNSVNDAFANDCTYQFYPFKYVPRPIPDFLVVPADIYKKMPVSNKAYNCFDLGSYGRKRLLKKITDEPRENTLYKSMNVIFNQILSDHVSGIVMTSKNELQGFALFNECRHKLCISTIYTHARGSEKELFIYTLKFLKTLAKNKDLVFVENDNNLKMIQYFERAAKIIGTTYYIKKN